MCTQPHTYHTHTHTTYVYIYTYTHTMTPHIHHTIYTDTHTIHIHTHIQPHYPTCVYAQTHTHIHNHTLPHTYIYTDIYTHTHTIHNHTHYPTRVYTHHIRTPHHIYSHIHHIYIHIHATTHHPTRVYIQTHTHTRALVQCVALSIPAGESLVSLFMDFRAIRDPGILSWCAEALQLTWHCPRWLGRGVEPWSSPCPRQLHLSHCFCQFVKSGKNTFTDV